MAPDLRTAAMRLGAFVIGTRLIGRRRRPRVEAVPLDKAPAILEGLVEGLLGFWDERVIDRVEGGYRLGHDWRGRPTGDDSKHLVTQARTAFFFARLARSRFGDDRHLQWSEHGIRFLRERMWDRVYGGFPWEVGPEGTRDARKHVYGQAFAVFALSEFAHAADDAEVAALAAELVDLVEARTHDARHGGYLESRAADWSPEPLGSTSVLGRPAECKTMNTHLHLIEALTNLAAVRPSERLRDRLRELIRIMSGPVVDVGFRTCWDSFARDWRPLGGYRSSYGHDLENVWLLFRACVAAGVGDASLEPMAALLWDNALARGFDDTHGGFFEAGPAGRDADRRDKVWWVQAEALVSALEMFVRTGADRYRRAFELTLGWIDAVQADREGGDWHAVIDSRGVPSGDKSGAWKDPYHQGRALLECLELLAHH